MLLFVAKGGDGVESSRLACRPDAEHDADGEAEQGGDGDRVGFEPEAPAGDPADEGRDGEADDDPDQAADERQRQGLDEELAEDVAAAAPRALRMPISRVRSRTETSMMFMIPMPPTISEIEAIPPSSSVSVPLIDDGRLEQLGLVEDLEVVRVGRGQLVARRGAAP